MITDHSKYQFPKIKNLEKAAFSRFLKLSAGDPNTGA